MLKFKYLVCLLIQLSISSVAFSQESLEQRVERLEREVKELRARLGLVDTIQSQSSNDNTKYGLPCTWGTILSKKYFVLSYNDTNKIANWVSYHLMAEDSSSGVSKRRNNFHPDEMLAARCRSELVDYKNSGFDRGHMAPAGDFKRNDEAMSETFVLSNMAPQCPRLNRGIWENLESQVRDLVSTHGSVWIVTGPLFLNEKGHHERPTKHIGPDQVAVPTHFYKVLLCEHPDGKREMFAFVMENSEELSVTETRACMVSVDSVESASGLDFFGELPDSTENRLDAHVAEEWPVR